MVFVYIREATRSLSSAKQRTVLALIGIVIGVASVIAMVSVGIIAGEETMRDYKSMDTDVLVVKRSWHGDSEDAEEIELKDVLELPLNVNVVDSVSPLIADWISSYSYFKYKYNWALMTGITASFKDLNSLQLDKGRFISNLDKNKPYVVVGRWQMQEIAEKMKIDVDKINFVGSKVKLGGQSYIIIGTLKEKPPSLRYQYLINNSFMMPLSTFLLNFPDERIYSFPVRIKPNVDYKVAMKEIEKYLTKRVKGTKIEIESAEAIIEQEAKQARRYTLLQAAIGSIALLVSGVGIMNVMLTSVAERRKEIGILRTIGARQKDIQNQFLIEAIILSLIGGTLGTALGIGASYLVAQYNEWHFVVSYNAIFLGVGVSSAVGIFFGFYPAYKAARLDPITALRSD